MASMKVMDLFCGTGGFSKGFENTGAFSVVYGIDVLPVAVGTFRLNHSRAAALEADIRTSSCTWRQATPNACWRSSATPARTSDRCPGI